MLTDSNLNILGNQYFNFTRNRIFQYINYVLNLRPGVHKCFKFIVNNLNYDIKSFSIIDNLKILSIFSFKIKIKDSILKLIHDYENQIQ